LEKLKKEGRINWMQWFIYFDMKLYICFVVIVNRMFLYFFHEVN
jgi:hypothetical protein